MLQQLRDRMTGPFVWFIVGLIVIPFAFFGIETFRSGGGDPTMAKVGDQKITQSQFRAAYDQRMAQLQAMMGEEFRADSIDTARFQQAVLDDMVQELLLRQHVESAGYRASDATLFEVLSGIPAFQEDGRFSTETYRSRLAMQGYSPQRFEKQLRDSLVIDQMREGILRSGFVNEAAVAQAYRVEQQKRGLAYAVFEASRYESRVKVDVAEVQARYEADRSRYRTPERVRLEYVELSLDALPQAERPDDSVLQVLYEADKNSRFSTPEERRARHILIRTGNDREAARNRIERVAEKIGKGADFASLARSHSEDPGSKEKGGDLGWVRRGQMTEKFEEVLFALAPGEVSDPVETEFGWHLMRVDDVREATTRPFSDPEVQAELLRSYRRRDAERRFQEMAGRLEQVAFESPGSLEPAAQAIGAEIRTTGWMTRDAGDGIAAQPAIREAAFSEDVLQAGENSRPLTIGDNHLVVVRRLEHEPARQKALEEVQDEIREKVRAEAARAKAAEDAAAVRAAVESGRSLAAAVAGTGATVRTPGAVSRDEAGIDRPILDALFRLQEPASGGGAGVTSVTLSGGDAAVVALTEVREAEWPPDSAQDRMRMASRLRDAVAGAEFAAYRADLERRTNVKVIARPEEAAQE